MAEDAPPKKYFGQHFLADRNILDAIADAASVGSADTVIEVGPGRGSLTRILAERAARVVALEIDGALVKAIRRALPENVEVLHADARRADPAALLGGCAPYKLLGNLPYYAAMPILRTFLESDCPPSAAAILVQREVASAMCAEPGSMSLASLGVQLFGRPWIYALEVGTWLLTQAEADNLREYLLRGGFLVVDDFHGTVQWAGFMRSMRMVFPDRSIVEVNAEDAIMSMHFDVDMTKPIPGIIALRYGVTWEHDGYVPTLRGIYDDAGRLMVIINFNVDLGDPWEMADEPWYPVK